METERYFSPFCLIINIDQPTILCASDRLGAELEVFDELGTLELY